LTLQQADQAFHDRIGDDGFYSNERFRSCFKVTMPKSKNARQYYRAAWQRFEDADFLMHGGRTTAAVYLAGYGVECILKALILAAVPSSREEGILQDFRGSRAHDFESLRKLLSDRSGAALTRYVVRHFAHVNTWSTEMRYSPGTVRHREAKAFLDSARAILTWADGRMS